MSNHNYCYYACPANDANPKAGDTASCGRDRTTAPSG